MTTNHGPFDADLTPLYRAIAHRVPVVAISHHQASTAQGVPIAAVIHHGVDVTSFPEGWGKGGYALFLGRMSPNKGLHTAIQVARAAGMPLRVAAEMQDRAEHESFAERIKPLLGPDVEYLGEVGGEAKSGLLADAACLLNPIAWPEPFAYPTSCIPQAWAAAAPIFILRMLLRLDPGVPHGQVWLAPALPPAARRLRVQGVPIADARVTVEVDGDDVSIEGLPAGIDVVRRPRPPIDTLLDDVSR